MGNASQSAVLSIEDLLPKEMLPFAPPMITDYQVAREVGVCCIGNWPGTCSASLRCQKQLFSFLFTAAPVVRGSILAVPTADFRGQREERREVRAGR